MIPIQAATYYVDSVAGADINTGLTQTAAWRTLEKVSSITFQPGDAILFKAGGSWTGTLSLRGEQGWQGTAWALERLHPARFARPEVMNQIAVVNQAGKASAERVIVLPEAEFDALIDRPGYRLRENGDLERREGSLVYLIVRQQSNRALPVGD